MLDLTAPHNRESLGNPGVGNTPASVIMFWFRTVGLALFRKMKRASEISASTPIKMLKMTIRNGYVPRTHFFSVKDLTN
jgi:hypothetical protein